MKALNNKALWNLYFADLDEDEREVEEARIEAEREAEWEESEERREAMRALVAEWVLGGDEMSHSIWSDLWKDEYGMRPRYTKEEAAYLYNLPYGEAAAEPAAEAVWSGEGFEDTLEWEGEA